MSYSVTCPSCNEKNPGSAFRCVKCHTNLIGIPRQEGNRSEYGIVSLQKITSKGETDSSDENKHLIVESVWHALWRHFRTSLITFFLTSLFTALICWLLNKRTLYDFGNALFYAGAFLAFISWSNFRANQRFFQSRANPLNPMSKVMPGTYLESTKQFWLDYEEGATSVLVRVVSIILCWGLGWLIVSLVN